MQRYVPALLVGLAVEATSETLRQLRRLFTYVYNFTRTRYFVQKASYMYEISIMYIDIIHIIYNVYIYVISFIIFTYR